MFLDLNDIDKALVPELRKPSEDGFDLDSIVSSAEEQKYIGQIKRGVAQQFHARKKYRGVFDENKAETRHPISTLDETYAHAEQLREAAARYDAAA